MLDGFNQGWIDFPQGDPGILKGRIGVREVVASLVRTALADEAA